MPETHEAVIEFGPDDDAERTPRRRFSVAGFAAGLARDRRGVPLAAVLGAVALFGSLVSEWQRTVIDFPAEGNEPGVITQSAPSGIAELAGWGAGYLCGLFLLLGAAVIALFGPPAGRRYAQLIALSTGGVLLGVLAALGSYLGETSGVLGQWGTLNFDQSQVQVSLGRGIWCAVAGVVLVMLAVHLAGRGEEWSWRRSQAEPEEDEGPPDAPFELTVGPARPFTASPGTRDKPSDGISG